MHPRTDAPALFAPLLSLLVVVGAGACHDGREPERVPEVRSADVNTVSAGALTLPNRATSVKFAVIGDSGRGTAAARDRGADGGIPSHFLCAFMLMLGDNIYEGPATREDYRRKFEDPYRTLLDEGVSSTPCLATTTIRARSSTRSSTWTASVTTASRLPRISSPRS